MRTFIFLLAFLNASALYAAEVCTTVDTAFWTQEQKNERQAAAYQLAFETGRNVVPTIKGDQVCFESPVFNVSTTITGQKILDKISANNVLRAAAAAQQNTIFQEITTINSQLESDESVFDSLTTAQKLAVVKKIIRREALKQKL